MKALSVNGSKPEDYLRLDFGGSIDPRVPLQQELEPYLHALEQYAGDWMPDIVESKRRRRYNRTALEKALEEARREKGAIIGFYRTQWPALDMTLELWFPPLTPELNTSLNVKPLSFFSDPERCQQFVELVREWAIHYPVSHALAHSQADDQLAGAPYFGRDEKVARTNGFDRIYELSWLNVFGPELVRTVGRERMLSTPAHRVEELPTGAILLVTWPTAADFATPQAREAQARAHVHLRPDLDLPTVLHTLHQRSATLAPVQPRFPPDFVPLLSRVVDTAAIHERQRKIAELNAWHPPEPDEWLPFRDALPPDVEDPERVLAHYSLLAEHLVAMLHPDVPSLSQYTLESLTDTDFHLWSEDFPQTRLPDALEQKVLPALGAYLGQVLVHELGGQWLPRRKLGEAQVRVGQRVWWPMVRAQRYLRSRQSLLDFSLTGLYRAAERSRD